MTNSIKKGKSGEREFSNKLRSIGINARRSKQYCGSNGDADIICDLPLFFEVKRCQNLNLHKAMEKALAECQPEKIPVIAHRKNGKEWLVTLRFENIDFFSKVMENREIRIKNERN